MSEFLEVLDLSLQENLKTLALGVQNFFVKNHFSLAVAESITGGGFCSALTQNPGSSQYLKGGVVCYSPQAKISLVGILAKSIAEEGAVSKRVTEELAQGIRKRLKATVGLAITGVAGPDTGQYPNLGAPGDVWVVVSLPQRDIVKDLHLSGNRAEIIQETIKISLRILLIASKNLKS